MERIFWMIIVATAFVLVKANKGDINFEEIFCADGVTLLFISKSEKEITKKSTGQFRILRHPDGQSLEMKDPNESSKEWDYPVVYGVTPITLSDKSLILPGLKEPESYIGLQFPEGLEVVVLNLLLQKPPIKKSGFTGSIFNAANRLSGMIDNTVAPLKTGGSRNTGSFQALGSIKNAAKATSDAAVSTTKMASAKLSGMISTKTASIKSSASSDPTTSQALGSIKNAAKATSDAAVATTNLASKHVNEVAKKIPPKYWDEAKKHIQTMKNINSAMVEAGSIVADSIKRNTGEVVQHKFGDGTPAGNVDSAVTTSEEKKFIAGTGTKEKLPEKRYECNDNPKPETTPSPSE